MSSIRGQKLVDFTGKSVCRLTIKGKKFEVIVDPNLAYKMKTKGEHEESIDVREALESYDIFSNAYKGERASQEDLLAAFETEDIFAIAERIIINGSLQMTTEQRELLAEKKRKAIIRFIIKNCVDPRTNLPHTPTRVDSALKKAKVSIDPFGSVEEQAKDVVKAIMSILPIRMERVKIAIKVPADSTGKAYGIIKRFGEITQEQWTKDGSLIVVISLAAGLQGELMEKVGRVSGGKAQIRILEREKV
ncbi:MAG: ribosome assembly factor SBDS [Candidatus Hodarchaeota archaeon]